MREVEGSIPSVSNVFGFDIFQVSLATDQLKDFAEPDSCSSQAEHS